MEIQDKLEDYMKTAERIEFRYSNRLLCYLIQTIGMIVFGYSLYFIFSITIERYLSDFLTLYSLILVIFNIVSFIAVITIPMLVAIKISDRCAYADFYNDRVEISLWLRKITIKYVDITKIDWYWVQFGSNRRSSFRRKKNYSLKVHKVSGSVTIAASFMETNTIAKNGGSLSLKAVYEQLCLRSGQTPKYDD